MSGFRNWETGSRDFRFLENSRKLGFFLFWGFFDLRLDFEIRRGEGWGRRWRMQIG